MATTYYGETDRTRGVLVYSTSQTNTAVTITAKTQLEAKSYGYSGYRVNVTIDNTATKTKLSYVPGYYATWTFCFETDNASKTITRTHSAQSIVISSSYKGEGTGDYYAGGKSGSTTVTVTVPAKTSYAVTYNANGGSGGATSDTKWYDETLTISSNAPTRTGYTFAGWNTKSDGTGTNYSAGASYTTNGALTLYAKWTVNTYTVSYNGNGSTGGSTSAQTKTYGTALTLRSNGFTKTGYTFSKWNTKSDGTGTSYNAGASYTANSAVTLYAIWTINKYTISYNANGGTGAPSAQTKNYGATLTLSTTKPTKTGATFANWKASNGTTYASGGSYTANESTTMTAQWSAITYTISYNANGGSNAPASETKTYGVAKTITTSIPTKTGCTFTGWSGSNGVSYAKGATIPADVNQNLTLTAQWATITYSVTYSANGGSGAPGTQSKTYGQALTLSSTVPTRTGYRFTGWSGSNGVTYQAGGTVAANVNQNLTMTAQWALLTYTITYNANGGSGAPSAGTKTYGQAFTISSTVPTRSSYNFTGWATSSTATSAQYSAGGTIPANVNQNVTLYAVWATAYVAPKIYYQTEGKIPQINRDATDDTKALVAFTWKVFSSTSNTVSIAYRLTGASSYTTLWSASRSTTTGTESQTVSPSGGFDTSKTYDIRISVADGTQTSYYNGFLSSGFFILNHSASAKGKSVGVGQAPVETDVPNNGRLDIGMDVHLNGKVPMNDTTYGRASEGAAIKFSDGSGATSPFTPAFMLPSKVGSWALATYPGSGELFYFVYNDGSGTSNTNTKRYYLDPSKGNADTTNRIFTTAETIGIGNGGTGATTAQNARTNLETKYWHAFEGLDSSHRLTTANQDPGNGKMIWFHATASMTTGKPYSDGYILHFAWDNSSPSWATQLWLGDGKSGRMQIRGRDSSSWGEWQNVYTEAFKPTAADVGAASASHNHSGVYIPMSGGTTTGDLGSNTWLISDNTTTNGSGVRMRFSDKSNADYVLMFASREANYGGRLIFREWSENSSGTHLGYYENFRLPRPNQGRTDNATYDILTTKGVSMTGYFMLQNSTQYPVLRFKPSHSTSNGDNTFGPASIWINAGSTTAVTMNKMYFRLYSPTASSGSTTYTGHYEQFVLPDTNIGRTGNAEYNILTSKNAVTIAQGGTGATTRLGALLNLTSEDVGTSTEFFLTITRNWTKGGYCSVANAKTVLGITGTQYGSNHMGWKKVSITLTNGAGSVACTGVTADSVVQATRVGTYSDTSGGYSTHIGAAASNAGNIKVFSTATGTVTWNVYLWWSKTATGG